MTEHIERWACEIEDEGWLQLQPDVYSEAALRDTVDANMVASLVVYGLVPPRGVPNFEAIRNYLSERFKFFEDDIERRRSVLLRRVHKLTL